ncbi:hypothetical protein TWF481_011631 [Arthrobotrys musiformis]|uniref:Uncharacterized protein n=1 Tax=Arthrobotrys musiformis TaxID=47236 RepID=A0AAV9W016_9PEZI
MAPASRSERPAGTGHAGTNREEYLILLAGAKGAGKSFFSGPGEGLSDFWGAGEERGADGREIETRTYEIASLRLVLIEAPALTNENIPAVRQRLDEFLKNQYSGKRLSGIVYLQRIDSEPRAPNITRKALRTFRGLLDGGRLDYKRVCLVTNFWGSPPTRIDDLREGQFMYGRGEWAVLRDLGADYRKLRCYDVVEERGRAETAIAEILCDLIVKIRDRDSGEDDEEFGFEISDETGDSNPSHLPSLAEEYPPLWAAVSAGAIQKVKNILKSPDIGNQIDWQNGSGVTALMKAVEINQSHIAKLLLKAGASPTATRDKNGKTALHLAASLGRNKIVQYMIEHVSTKDEVDVRTKTESTLLHLACRNKRNKTVNLLLKSGADIWAVDDAGRSPLFFGISNGDRKIMRAVIRSGPISDKELKFPQLSEKMVLRLAKRNPADVLDRFWVKPAKS